MDLMRVANRIPSEPMEAESKSISGSSASTVHTEREMPISGANSRMRIPWSSATVAAPNVFPTATEARLIGATSTSLRKPNSRSQTTEIPEKERARIEARIGALKVAGVKQLEAMTEATERQLKAVAASEIKEAQDVAREIRSEFATFFTQLDRLSEKAVHLGEELERSKQELQKYEKVKDTLESHAVATEAEK